MGHESQKALAVFGIIVFSLTAGVVWIDDRPTNIIWVIRIGASLLSVACLGLFLVVHYRRDVVPDFLSRYCNNFFDAKGFCFNIQPIILNDVCALQVLYQCRHDRPCTAHVALRPEPGIFRRIKLPPISFQISCDPAAFGVAFFPMAIPITCQGKSQRYSIGATVDYPIGRGDELRVRDGMVVSHNAQFCRFLGRTTTLIGLMGGHIIYFSPASFTMQFPLGVAESVLEVMQPVVKQLWKLDDDPNVIFTEDQFHQ